MTVFGWHTGPGGNSNGIGTHWHTLDAARIPAFLKSVDSYGPCFELANIAKASGVNHTIVYRISTAGHGNGIDYDVPDYSLSPVAAANKHWTNTLANLPPEFDKQRVWVEPINEVDKNRADWLGQFAVEIAELANAQGYKVTLFGWSSGEPEIAHWQTPGMLAYLRYCASNPGKAAISLHEYSYSVSNIKDGYPYKIGRFTQLLQVCNANNIAHPEIHITEWGWEYNNAPDTTQAMADIEWSHSIYAPYPNVKGVALWYLGAGWSDICNKIQRLISPVTQFTLDNPPTEPLPPVPTLHKLLILKKPAKSEITKAENDAANDYAWTNYGRTSTHSVDDMIRMLSGGNAESYCVLAYPDKPSQEDAKLALGLGKYNWIEWPESVPPVPSPQIKVTPINQRNPAWANVDMGGDNKKIGDWGCLLVAYNIFANYLKLTNELPPAHMTRMKNAGAMSGPYMLPGAMKTTFPNDITYLGYEGRGDSLNARIRASIDKGYPVPARVDFNPATGQTEQHWVLITGYTATDFWCADPWFGDVVLLSTRYNISGNDVLEGIFYERKTVTPTGLDMRNYFMPKSGNYGQLFMLKNNWGAGDERCQLQSNSNISFVTKNSQYEQRVIDATSIKLTLDTSPGNDEYYTVTGTWLPRYMSPSQVFTRTETITFRYKSNCQPVANKPAYTATTNITFDKHHTNWTCPESNIVLHDVIELSWFAGGRIDERYWFANGLGLVRWEKYSGQKSWIHELVPVGSQQNNVREVIACL